MHESFWSAERNLNEKGLYALLRKNGGCGIFSLQHWMIMIFLKFHTPFNALGGNGLSSK